MGFTRSPEIFVVYYSAVAQLRKANLIKGLKKGRGLIHKSIRIFFPIPMSDVLAPLTSIHFMKIQKAQTSENIFNVALATLDTSQRFQQAGSIGVTVVCVGRCQGALAGVSAHRRTSSSAGGGHRRRAQSYYSCLQLFSRVSRLEKSGIHLLLRYEACQVCSVTSLLIMLL